MTEDVARTRDRDVERNPAVMEDEAVITGTRVPRAAGEVPDQTST
jgi:hypothetical protein